jgi:hypothetical protein
MAIRAGELNSDHVALCAYLKDPACENVFFSFVRNNRFFYFKHALENQEPADIIPNIRRWGTEATILAGCGVIRALARKNYLRRPRWYNDVEVFVKAASEYEPKTRGRGFNNAVPLLAQKYRFSSQFGLSTPASRAFGSLIGELMHGMRWPGIDSCRIANGFLDDGAMLDGMIEYIKPWALGEFI